MSVRIYKRELKTRQKATATAKKERGTPSVIDIEVVTHVVLELTAGPSTVVVGETQNRKHRA